MQIALTIVESRIVAYNYLRQDMKNKNKQFNKAKCSFLLGGFLVFLEEPLLMEYDTRASSSSFFSMCICHLVQIDEYSSAFVCMFCAPLLIKVFIYSYIRFFGYLN